MGHYDEQREGKSKKKPHTHEPTKAQRDTVTLHAMVGTPQEEIARVLGISDRTLRKHYRDELDLALAKANAQIGGSLFNKAKNGDTTAQIFWLKTRGGWSEKKEEKPTNDMASVLQSLIDKLPN